ncbi:MAG: 4-hydroxy-3-methylbut-2-enyl diphosphate reductase [Acidimicrobiales bacterium]
MRSSDGSLCNHLASAGPITAELRRSGLRAHQGPVASAVAFASFETARLSAAGVLAADNESVSVLSSWPGHPAAVVRWISHTPGRSAESVDGPGPSALGIVRSTLEAWARACGRHEVLLAAPRSFCAGVDRAIETVRRALDRFGAPVYVRRQIVHNLHVVRHLETLGAVFVEELDEVPPAATVVFAAHGVSPAVRSQAAARPDLTVIDATCPLVAKVHSEARRFAAQGHNLVLIGHSSHEEVEGTLGEAPDRFHVVEGVDDVARLDLDPSQSVAFLTQTTLATDQTAEVVAALRARFPLIVAPAADDICYATQNRQDALRSIAHRCDLMLVVGSANSSNTARLVEVARREGCRAELLEDASQLQLGWLDGVTSVGLTAGASAPDFLVREVLETIGLLGPLSLTEDTTAEETVRFALPTQVR